MVGMVGILITSCHVHISICQIKVNKKFVSITQTYNHYGGMIIFQREVSFIFQIDRDIQRHAVL